MGFYLNYSQVYPTKPPLISALALSVLLTIHIRPCMLSGFLLSNSFTYYTHNPPPTTHAGQTPLQVHAESRELRTALVAGGADPSTLVDDDGNTLLHKAQTAKEITDLLKGPLVDVNVTNQV